jgi:hypothetical protein
LTVATTALATAAAADPFEPLPVAIELGDWVMTPIVQKTPTGQVFHSLLALNTAQTGQNLSAVWYVRDVEAGECHWLAKTFGEGTAEDAVKAVKLDLGITNAFDAFWGLTPAPSGCDVSLTPPAQPPPNTPFVRHP